MKNQHTLLSYLLVIIGVIAFVLNYEYYSVDYMSKIIENPSFINIFENISSMLKELGLHIQGFFIQYYNKYIININLENYKSLAIAVKALFGGFRDYFMNIITLMLFTTSIYIRTDGNFFEKARKPFQLTVLITVIYVFLLVVDNLNI